MKSENSSATKDTAVRQAKGIARKYDPEPTHAIQVVRLSLRLFDIIQTLHQLGSDERRLLEVAAWLHDIGYAVSADKHNKHSRDLILQQKIDTLTERDISIVACIARYHRGAEPQAQHALYRGLEPNDQMIVRILSAIIRVADGLDRSHCSDATDLDFTCENKNAVLRVRQREENSMDIEGGSRKAGLFEAVFDVHLHIEGYVN